MAWFKKNKDAAEKRVNIPEGLWVKCNSCKEIIYRKEVERNLKVCPKCNYHFRLSAKERIPLFVDEGSFIEIDRDMASSDPLGFNPEGKDTKGKNLIAYKTKLNKVQKSSDLNDPAVSGNASINGMPVIIIVLDFSFFGGSMGSVVGEKFVRAVEKAYEENLPFLSFASSGGARMQEGIISLMQMAKTSAAIAKYKKGGMPYISILADPTFGGVSASFAMLGDIIIAEPKSLIGFAGRRVIEQTINQKLPDNFQTAEFLFEHGMIDMIVPRKDMKSTIGTILSLTVDDSN
jgi:acetyl-CoA carboxylase carboxyl transferase subunit beta